jgi:hypothetical protein
MLAGENNGKTDAAGDTMLANPYMSPCHLVTLSSSERGHP